MTEQVEAEPTAATYEEVPVEDLRINDVVEGHGLVVKIEDDDKGKVVGFGSARRDEAHVEESVPFEAGSKVKRMSIRA